MLRSPSLPRQRAGVPGHRSRHARGLLAVSTLGLLALSACGSADTSVAPRQASAGPASTTSAEPSAAATPSTPEPADAGELSEELRETNDTPEARAVKRFYAGLARAVNDGDWDNADLRATSTEARAERNEATMEDYAGQRFPGPIPFTAAHVTSTGGSAVVVGCSVDSGWGENAAGEPVGGWAPSGAKIELVQDGSDWRIDAVHDFEYDCSEIPLETEEW